MNCKVHHLYLENWIKYQIVYKQVNNENEIEKFKTTKVFLKLIEGKYNFEINLYRENQKKQFTKSN